jgi:transposase
MPKVFSLFAPDSCTEILKLHHSFTTKTTSATSEMPVTHGTIALFFTGRQHAGENLATVLRQRAAALAPPMQMCDALSRNLPKLPEKLEVIVGHCVAHARRRFVEVIENFPQPCRHLLEQLGTVYSNDATVRKQAMTAEERLRNHQQHSAPMMEELRAWLNTQFAEKKVEPNSGLGMAMRYLHKHWERLTLFLRQSGAPLDNNICERALKKAILHRKNSLFYRTANGARVGDLFMSLIHTCELSGANPSTTSPSCSSTPQSWPATRGSGCRGTIKPRWSHPAPVSTPARVK